MKTKLTNNWAAGALAAIIGLAGGTGFVANAQDQPPLPPPPTAATPVDNTAPADSTAFPPNIYPSSPLAQVIKLTQSGVSENVIMAYVANSGSRFNLDPDKIIYLKDIGAPDDLVTAMMQRDQVLQAQMAASAYQPPPQPAPATETGAAVSAPVEEPAPVTVDYFYTTLAPYGAWVDVEGYGRCWRPTVVVGNAGWQPYGDHGHWVWTDCGWYWISDYTWGWAPFHYGRWFHHERFGWCWYPDTVWGPSWVTWRYSDDYCGWAPLPPRAVYREGFGFFYNGAAVSVGFDFGLGVGAFTFVHTRDFCDPRPWRHRVESREVTQIFNRTTVINNFDVDRRNRNFINHGIDPEHITEVTHAPIRPIAIHEAPAPDQRGDRLGRDGRTLFVNRPHFNDNPPPAGDRGNPPRTGPIARPGVGSPYQPPAPRADNSGSPDRNGPTPPIAHPSPPPAPAQPSAPNYNSTDNRRYPSPRMQQPEQPNPRMNPGNSGGRVGAPATPPAQPPAPTQPPQRNYSAPVTLPSPPARQPEANRYTPPVPPQPAPAQPPQRSYSAPVAPPAPPAQGDQTHAAPAPSSPPAQSQPSQPSQRSGRDKNQNGP